MTTNELQLAKAFRDAGFPQDKAEAVSETIFAAIRDNVATKSDVELSAAALRQDVQLIRTELQTTAANLRAELQTTAANLRTELQSLKLWLGAGMVAGFVASFGLLFTALHLWPPHS